MLNPSLADKIASEQTPTIFLESLAMRIYRERFEPEAARYKQELSDGSERRALLDAAGAAIFEQREKSGRGAPPRALFS